MRFLMKSNNNNNPIRVKIIKMIKKHLIKIQVYNQEIILINNNKIKKNNLKEIQKKFISENNIPKQTL
jgi:hypothetical protein